METYDTLSQAISALQKQGYTADLNLKSNCVHWAAGNKNLPPEEFSIDKFFRFDVDEDPADQAVLYAISSRRHRLKGLLVNGYGLYSDSITNEMAAKLGGA